MKSSNGLAGPLHLRRMSVYAQRYRFHPDRAAGSVAIVAILAAILFPVFARARGKARFTSCLSNVKQITFGPLAGELEGDQWHLDDTRGLPGDVLGLRGILRHALGVQLLFVVSMCRRNASRIGWSAGSIATGRGVVGCASETQPASGTSRSTRRTFTLICLLSPPCRSPCPKPYAPCPAVMHSTLSPSTSLIGSPSCAERPTCRCCRQPSAYFTVESLMSATCSAIPRIASM